MKLLRNFAVPHKRTDESWTAYHDRLAALVVVAKKARSSTASMALQLAAAKVAKTHPEVKSARRKGKRSGPGTLSWEQCVSDARRRGARDPKAVCGSIRAKSRAKYPAYWGARRNQQQIKWKVSAERGVVTHWASDKVHAIVPPNRPGEKKTWNTGWFSIDKDRSSGKFNLYFYTSNYHYEPDYQLLGRHPTALSAQRAAQHMVDMEHKTIESAKKAGFRNASPKRRNMLSDDILADRVMHEISGAKKALAALEKNYEQFSHGGSGYVRSFVKAGSAFRVAVKKIESADRYLDKLSTNDPRRSELSKQLSKISDRVTAISRDDEGYLKFERNQKSRNKPACGVQFVGVGSGAPAQAAIPCRNPPKGSPLYAKLRQLQADVRSFERLKKANSAEIYRYLVLAAKAKSGADALHLVHKADALKDLWMGAGVARGEVHDEIQAVRRLVMAHWKDASRNKKSSRRKR